MKLPGRWRVRFPSPDVFKEPGKVAFEYLRFSRVITPLVYIKVVLQ